MILKRTIFFSLGPQPKGSSVFAQALLAAARKSLKNKQMDEAKQDLESPTDSRKRSSTTSDAQVSVDIEQQEIGVNGVLEVLKNEDRATVTESDVHASNEIKFVDESNSGGSKDGSKMDGDVGDNRPSSAGPEPQAIQIWISKSISMEDDLN